MTYIPSLPYIHFLSFSHSLRTILKHGFAHEKYSPFCLHIRHIMLAMLALILLFCYLSRVPYFYLYSIISESYSLLIGSTYIHLTYIHLATIMSISLISILCITMTIIYLLYILSIFYTLYILL